MQSPVSSADRWRFNCSLFVAVVLSCLGAGVAYSAEPNEAVAYLQNRIEFRGSSTIKYYFQYVDEQKLPSRGRNLKILGSNSIVHEIQPGKRVLAVEVEYLHGLGLKMQRYRIFVGSDVGFNISDRMTPEERATFGARNGFTIDAEEGQTYQINCRFEDGRVFVWIEVRGGEAAGTIVSETFAGHDVYRDKWRPWTGLPQP